MRAGDRAAVAGFIRVPVCSTSELLSLSMDPARIAGADSSLCPLSQRQRCSNQEIAIVSKTLGHVRRSCAARSFHSEDVIA